ncbi:hypothetical protein Tco_0449156 [Tanacetum coccineum]
MQPRNKIDEEFDAADTLKEQCDIQASNILSQGLPRRIFNTLNQNESAKEIWDSLALIMKGAGQTIDRRKEDLFDEYERFRAKGNEPIYDYFVRFHKLINDKNAKDMSTVSYVDLFTHLRSYEEHAMKTLRKQEQSSSVADPLAYLAKTTLQLVPTHSTTNSPSQLTPVLASTSSSPAQSHDAAMLATMQQIANLLSGFQKQFPPTNNQLRSSSNTRSQATVHDGQITTETVQRRAPGNVGNTGSRGNQNNGQGVNNQRKVICYNCREEGHVALKEKGAVLDAEAEAFLADVECTVPLAEPLALSTTNMFQVSHEDAYDSDVDDEPNAAAAFMANLSSSSSQINEVRTFNDTIFETVSHSLSPKVPHDEHLDSDDDEVLEDYTIPYDQYLATKDSQDVPTEASPDPPSAIPPSAAYMLNTLSELTTQVEGHRKVNQKQALVNATLTAELDRCKLELARLEHNKVKLENDQVILARNKQNAKLKQETESLKTTLRNKEATIAHLTCETKTVLSEKKTLEDKYLEEIVCLKSANQVATGLLQKFQMPTQTIPMLSKKPMIASSDIHKIGLGFSNPWYGRKAQLSQPALYDGHRLLQPGHARVTVHDSDETLLETEVSRMKMSQKPGHVKPIDYAKLNALYDQFVPQKELSREQAYWLSATDIASLTSDPPKLVTPFVRTSPAKSQVQDQLWYLKAEFSQFDESLKREPHHFTTILQGSPVEIAKQNRRYLELSKASTHSRNTSTEKLAALHDEIAKMKPSGCDTKVSGPKTPEKNLKVLAPGMYAISSKYIPPPKQADWIPPTPRKKHVTFQEPTRASTRHTKQTAVNNHKKPNVNVIVSTGMKPAAGVSKTQSKSDNQKSRVLPLRNLKPQVARPKTTPNILRKTDLPLHQNCSSMNPTSRQFLLCDIYGPKKSMTPIAKPLALSSSVVQIVLWYLDSGCSRHMTGDRSKAANYV